MRNNRKLYETIMTRVAREVKKALNEAYDENRTYYVPGEVTPEFTANLNYGRKRPALEAPSNRVQPQTKEELILIIKDTIKKNGKRCDLNFIDTSKITDMSRLFGQCGILGTGYFDFNGDISGWDVSHVTTMESMFQWSKFKGDISNWDVSHVTNMRGMFYGSKFDGDISNWDVSRVTTMENMFGYSENFDGDISNWDIRHVTNMSGMFSSSKEFNGDISGWDVSNVRNMSHMFLSSNFTSDISNWDVSRVKDMRYMFYDSKFRGDISKWNIDLRTKIAHMCDYTHIPDKFKPYRFNHLFDYEDIKPYRESNEDDDY